ncbi:MAG: alpha/beta hydrolase [Actinomycetota bacterium]
MTAPRVARIALVMVIAVSVGCGGGSSEAPEDAPAVQERDVRFRTTDDLTLTGRLFGRGKVGVTLAHMFPSDATSWYPAARRLAGAGYMTLAFNFRGYATSQGDKEVANAPKDIAAAMGFLRDADARDVAFVGASMGGTASIVAAEQLDPVAVVSISAPLRFMGLDAPAIAGRVQRPVLLFAARGDGEAFTAVEELERALPNPETKLYEGDAHGTNLLADRPEAIDEILTFLRRYAPLDRSTPVGTP